MAGKTLRYYLPVLIFLLDIGICNGSNPESITQHISLEILPGGALIVPSTLFIHQDGEDDLKFTANYETHSFNLPVYYSYRLGIQIQPEKWVELEMNHLKVYLQNKPDEIERFTITHGYNQIWMNYKWKYHQFYYTVGIGPVLAHPENTIRGLALDETKGIMHKGYYIAGISSQLALQKKFFLGRNFFFSVESKANLAFAKVPVANGYAKVPVAAFHGLAGMGITF